MCNDNVECKIEVINGIKNAILGYVENIKNDRYVLHFEHGNYEIENNLKCDEDGFKHGSINALLKLLQFVEDDEKWIKG